MIPTVTPARTLTDADLEAISKMIEANHACRFNNVTREDMDFIKDLLSLYKETRSEVIKWVVRGCVYGALLLMAGFAYLKIQGKSP